MITSRKLLFVALEQELPKDGLSDWSIVYTGVGKVNAAITLMAALTRPKPDLLINCGTIGTITSSLERNVKVGQSVQRDMDTRILCIALGATPFETRQNVSVRQTALCYAELPLAL